MLAFLSGQPLLQNESSDIGNHTGQEGEETTGICTIDCTVVVGQRNRQHVARHEFLTIPHRFDLRTGNTEDRYFRSVYHGRETTAAHRTEAGDRETATLHFSRSQLAFARFLGQCIDLISQFPQPFLIHVAYHRNQQAYRRIHSDTDVHIVLLNNVLTVVMHRDIEAGLSPQGRRTGFQQERQRRQLAATFLSFRLQTGTEGFHLRDVHIVPLCYMRNVEPVAGHVFGGELFDLAHLDHFDLAKLGVIDRRYPRHAGTTPNARAALPPGSVVLPTVWHVILQQPPAWAGSGYSAQIHPQLTSQLTYSRARLHVTGLHNFFNFCRRTWGRTGICWV